MANALTGNPIRIESAAAIWTTMKYVQLIQWIDNAADLTDDDDIVLAINGVVVTGKIALAANTINNLVVWEMAFNPPMRVEKFTVTTLDSGNLIVWLA